MRMDLVVHIVAGGLGLLSGFVALSAAKGASVHRKAGMVFVYAMITMALVGSGIAFFRGVAPAANGPIGLLTAYLVISALATVRPVSARSRQVDVGLLLVVLSVTATLYTFGFRVLASETRMLYGMPAAVFLGFAVVGSLAIVGDLQLIRAGGVQSIRGAPRLKRHLWRMSTALLIASFSFFLGQAKVIPKPIRIMPLLFIPPLAVLVTLVYWLWRMRAKRKWRSAVRLSVVEAT